jgi:hypothetical protein
MDTKFSEIPLSDEQSILLDRLNNAVKEVVAQKKETSKFIDIVGKTLLDVDRSINYRECIVGFASHIASQKVHQIKKGESYSLLSGQVVDYSGVFKSIEYLSQELTIFTEKDVDALVELMCNDERYNTYEFVGSHVHEDFEEAVDKYYEKEIDIIVSHIMGLPYQNEYPHAEWKQIADAATRYLVSKEDAIPCCYPGANYPFEPSMSPDEEACAQDTTNAAVALIYFLDGYISGDLVLS